MISTSKLSKLNHNGCRYNLSLDISQQDMNPHRWLFLPLSTCHQGNLCKSQVMLSKCYNWGHIQHNSYTNRCKNPLGNYPGRSSGAYISHRCILNNYPKKFRKKDKYCDTINIICSHQGRILFHMQTHNSHSSRTYQ